MADTAQSCLRKIVENIAAERNYNECNITITPISSGGANYTSELFTATIAGQGKDESKKALNLFGKVAILSQKQRDELGFTTWNTENYFYTTLMKKYREIEDMYGVSGDQRLNVPEFYAYDPTYLQETLVLEDLSAAGYESFDRYAEMEENYTRAAVRELANFHALGFAFRTMFPEEYDEVLNSGNFDFKAEFFDTISAGPLAIALENVQPEYQEKLKKFSDKYMSKFSEFFKPGLRPVFAHLDYRGSNLMHKVHESGDVDIKIIDFQSPSEASPVIDLLYLMFSALDDGFRAKRFSNMTDLYYTTLSELLLKYNLNPEEVYSRAMFNYELKLKLPFALGISLMTLPYLTADKEEMSTILGTDLNNLVSKPGKLYPEKLHAVINDFVKLGVL